MRITGVRVECSKTVSDGRYGNERYRAPVRPWRGVLDVNRYSRLTWLLRDVRCIVLHRRWRLLFQGRDFCRRCRRWL